MTARRAIPALALVLASALPAGAGADVAREPSAITSDLKSLDGKRLTLTGTFGRARTHFSKKGERSYSFRISDSTGATIVVLTPTPPACRAGAHVVAEGIFDARARRLDAMSVACP